MINYYFEQPIYNSSFDSSLIELRYSTHRWWASNTTTSYNKENQITEKSHNALSDELYKFSKQVITKKHKIEIKEIWANEYLEKDFQEVHFHPKSHFSFCIMCKIPEGSGNIRFLNPYEDVGFDHNKISYKNFYFDVLPEQKENTILIWPSYIKHMVTPGNNKTKRITYSGNFNIIL